MAESRVSPGPLHSMWLWPSPTHKDVKEGGFELVVDDFLLQALSDASIGLQEEQRAAERQNHVPGLPLTP